MAKPSKLEFPTKSSGDQYTAAEANTVHTTIDAIIDDYASESVGVDADTLEGHTEAEVISAVKADSDVADALSTKHTQNTDTGTTSATFTCDSVAVILEGDARLTDARTPSSHGNEAHSSTFITATALSGYEQQTNKGAANGYAELDANTLVPTDQLGTETPDGTKFLRDDQTWQTPEAGTSALNGEVKLFNLNLGDIPDGWHLCDGTNGTEDLSLSNPSENTVYIQYIGGEYLVATARTINVTNTDEVNLTVTLMDAVTGTTITAIEDGTVFKMNIANSNVAAQTITITCTRDSDDTVIFAVNVITVDGESETNAYLSQYQDCTWTIVNIT